MGDIDIKNARESLFENGYTCVLRRGEEEFFSTLRGVRPLLDFLDSGKDFSHFSAADKTVGAGAAYLYILLGVGNVFALVMSERARELLLRTGIEVSAEKVVPYIINRAGDGPCPIETAVKDAQNPTDALEKIRAAIKELSEK